MCVCGCVEDGTARGYETREYSRRRTAMTTGARGRRREFVRTSSTEREKANRQFTGAPYNRGPLTLPPQHRKPRRRRRRELVRTRARRTYILYTRPPAIVFRAVPPAAVTARYKYTDGTLAEGCRDGGYRFQFSIAAPAHTHTHTRALSWER